ncbi:hypothetical protein [Dyella ginsengisoli]|uniref:hypothetical protein n=1 Tax=Dyella ginsengisoli TaxID=363848 RepID=UPI00034C007A|nr:hypothetical protein [Dyella ginsengisoli]
MTTEELTVVTETETVAVKVPVEFRQWLKGGYGLTPEQVLQAFVHDLYGTVDSNGSDERRMAEEWFDRVIWPAPPAGRVFQAQSGQWSWAIEQDGVELVCGAGYASEGAADEDMQEQLSNYT